MQLHLSSGQWSDMQGKHQCNRCGKNTCSVGSVVGTRVGGSVVGNVVGLGEVGACEGPHSNSHDFGQHFRKSAPHLLLWHQCWADLQLHIKAACLSAHMYGMYELRRPVPGPSNACCVQACIIVLALLVLCCVFLWVECRLT